MKHCRVLAGFTGIAGAFFSLYILFAGPMGVNLWYQAFVTLLLVGGGSMLLVSEKAKATYYGAGAYLISLVVIVLQFNEISRYAFHSFESISNYIYFLFIAFGLFAFLFSLISIFDKEYGRRSIFKRIT